ncbi:glycosyltransferase [Adhaeribacter radiodurans]|uniref:Glycosyltransferase n=1 Tax=Adhaeribacter radiodurans TaxID=2745197 RepID=A0A7L7L3H7_9BACT|nr:glycosyltransferase [Adhaeribacter radiodurans]QMU27347.1 glycosyltransferase [Adhaeribacter radiodurans]
MEELKKICFFPGTLALGGIGKVFINLIQQYASEGVEVHVFLTKKEGEFLSQLPANVRVFEGSGRALTSIFSFIKYLRREKPQAVLSAREFLNIINIFCCLFTFNKTKPVVSLHTNQTAENNADPNKPSLYKNPYFLTLAKVMYKVPDKIVAVSGGVADDFSNRMGVNRDKMKVIYNPVYDPSEKEEEISNSKFKQFTANGKKYIISVGRFTHAKDHPTLIKALSLVREKMDISLILLGEGELREEIEDLFTQLSLQEHVLLLGFVDNPSYYIKRAAALVVSSRFEGFGNVIVEGLGVGTPVVSTDCPSGPREILANGKYGILVPVENPAALAQGIIDTLNTTYDPEILINRAKDFSISRIANEYSSYIMS